MKFIDTTKKRIIAIITGLSLLSLFFGIHLHQALGNASYLQPACQTAPATSTVSFLASGLGTTTLSCDVYALASANSGSYPVSIQDPRVADSAILLIQQGASSTNSIMDIYVEYSDNNIDWYQNTYENRATTTPNLNISTIQNFRLQFASSTAGLGTVSSSNATTTRVINIPTPARYIRFIFVTPTGFAGSNVWAKFLAKKQL